MDLLADMGYFGLTTLAGMCCYKYVAVLEERITSLISIIILVQNNKEV